MFRRMWVSVKRYFGAKPNLSSDPLMAGYERAFNKAFEEQNEDMISELSRRADNIKTSIFVLSDEEAEKVRSTFEGVEVVNLGVWQTTDKNTLPDTSQIAKTRQSSSP